MGILGTKIVLMTLFVQSTQIYIHPMHMLLPSQEEYPLYNQKKRCEINKRDHKGFTLLHRATIDGDAGLVEKLLCWGANVNAINNKGQTPLFFADNPDVIILFLKHPLIDLNIQDVYGWTALMYSIRNLRLEEKRTLLFQCPNLDLYAKTKKGDTAHSIGMSKEYIPLTLSLGDLYHAHKTNKKHNVNEINWRDKNGLTLLHHAVMKNNEEEVIRLLQSGANINVTNHKGQTPLFLTNDANMIKLLLSNSLVDVNIQDIKGRTALIYAVESLLDEKVQLMLAMRPDIDLYAKTLQGDTALSTAMSLECNDLIILIQQYMDDKPLVFKQYIGEICALQDTWRRYQREYDTGSCLMFHRKDIEDFFNRFDI